MSMEMTAQERDTFLGAPDVSLTQVFTHLQAVNARVQRWGRPNLILRKLCCII